MSEETALLEQAVEKTPVENEVFAVEVEKTDPVTVVEEPKADRYEITAEEKFKARDLEADFLKAQLEMRAVQDNANRLQEIIKKTQTEFPKHIEGIAKRLGLNLDEYIFNSVELAFIKKPVEKK